MIKPKNSGAILINDTEIATYLDRFPHWVALQEQGKFEKDKALLCTKNWKEGFLSIDTRTYEDTFQDNKYPTLSALKKYLSEEHVDSILVILIQLFMDNYSFTPLTANQVKNLTRLIYIDFHHLNLGDFRLFFDNMLRGKYGKIYGRLDVEVFMVALGKYADERLEVGSSLNLKRHSMVKKAPMTAHKDIVEKLVEKLKIPKNLGTEEMMFDDIYKFARYKGFDINAFTSVCTKNIKHQYQLLKLQKGDAFTISEFDYQNLWLSQLLSSVNNTDTPLSKRDVFEMIKTMKVKT